jgi:transcriptional regulator with XRE-family HTH domain
MAITLADKHEAFLGLRTLTRAHQRGWSIPQLAKAARLPLSTVQKICAGKSKQPSVWTIWALAEVLDVSMDYLCGRVDSISST